PKADNSIFLTHRVVRFEAASRPSGSKLPRHDSSLALVGSGDRLSASKNKIKRSHLQKLPTDEYQFTQ
ncbi:hypothetical protein, partial [Pseudomonas sp. NFACC56-3]|uniref:hypothetical protein n=1 Tax=Pseudomonas sp. NFACC56-3 TaxID=1566217 RepID=UPI001C469F27